MKIQYRGADAVKDELIIKFKKHQGITAQSNVSNARASILKSKKAVVKKVFSIGAECWQISTDNIESLIQELKNNPEVEYVEPNYILSASMVPNDPYLGYCWAVNGTSPADIGAYKAWNITTGDTSIVVGVLDSGIDYLHEDLKDNIWRNPKETPGNGIDDDNNGSIDDIYGWNFAQNNNDPMDDYYHGTHVAGIIAAKGINGIGIPGVAWKVKLAAVKFLDGTGNGTTDQALLAFEYCIKNGIKIANCSWGGPTYIQALYDVISRANDAGVLVIAAAGNFGTDNDSRPQYPASYDLPNIISVAANDKLGNLWSFSNYGKTSVDLSAPGVDIFSSTPGNTYKYLSGTSMAAPFVSGAVVLIKSVYPDKTNAEIKSLLLSSADPGTSFYQKTVSGGRLNIYKTLMGAGIVNVALSDKELNFGGVILNSIDMPRKKFTVFNNSASGISIDTIKSEKGFLIANSSGVFSEILTGSKLEPGQSFDIMVMADPNEEKPYEGTVRLKIPGSTEVWKEVKCRMTAFSKGTLVTTSEVSGVWSKAMSPIIINGQVKVLQGQKLDVGPGTEVIFFNNAGISSVSEDLSSEFIIRAAGSKQDSICFKSIDPAAPWSGFSISGRGRYIFEYCNFLNASKPAAGQTDGNGGAISCSGPDLRIVNCGFYGNHASAEGAAVWYNGTNVFIDSSRFAGNDAPSGAALFLQGKENWLMNSRFRDNNCTLGMVKALSAAPNSDGKAFVYNCSFLNNIINSGNMIGASYMNKIVIKNCLASGNSIGISQGIINLNSDSTALVSNCTLYNNGTGGDGASLKTTKVSKCMLENSILWNNFNNEINASVQVNEKFTPSFNSIKNYSGGTGNLSTAPDFIADGSFRLSSGSTLKDKGNPLAVFNDKDGSKNDLGFEGGNELAFYPTKIEFDKTGPVNSPIKTVPVECVSFCKEAVPIQSLNVSSDAFTVALIPGQILPFNESRILISFSPKQVKSYSDTLYINTNFTPAKQIQILLSGVCEDINSLFGSISGELKNVNGGVYHVLSDILVPKDSSLTIDAGVSLLFQPNTKLTVEGDLEVRGTKEQKVIFSPEEEGLYAGIVTFRSYNKKNILLNNLVVRKMLGFNIQSITNRIIFNSCEFSDNRNSIEVNSPFFNIQNSTAEFNACRFSRNITEGPVLYLLSGKLFLSNCLISRNTSQGSYLLLDNSVTYISSSSVFNNKSASGIILRTDAAGALKDTCIIVNSIISDNLIANAKYEISLMSRNRTDPIEDPNVKIYLDISYSCIRGGLVKLFVPSGSKLVRNSTLQSDPYFADTTGVLYASSPCINAGVNTYAKLTFPVEDLSGNYRIWNRQIDMGAYEYGSKKYSPEPEIPVLDSPTYQAAVFKDVTFKWKPVPGAVKYYLQVSDTSTFTTTRFSDSTLTDTSKSLSLSTSSKYFWRVMAKNTLKWGQWSAALSFSTLMASPLAPVLKKPDNNSLNQPLALSLYWGKLNGAEKYQLQISANNNFSSLKDFSSLQVNDSSVVDTLKQITGLSTNAVYYWRVRAVNQGGVGEWSEEWTFKTLPPMPPMPQLVVPANSSRDNGVALKLSWKANEFTDNYRLVVAEDDSFKNIKFADSTLKDTLKEVKELKEGMKYFWKVSSKNPAGESPSSEVWNFTTLLNAPDSLKNSVISWNELRLSWKDKSSGEAGFIIERKQSFDFVAIDTVEADVQSYTDSTVQHLSSYKYRVRSYTQYVQSAYSNLDSVMITGISEQDIIPKDYSLLQNYPNPFNPATVIKYGLPAESHVNLVIYNFLGQEVGHIVNEIQRAGYHQINFNAGRIASGVYFYLLEARATDGSRDYRKVKKMLVVK
ncbi:MAG TPA: S8 family serine peptidase [Ignavibacteriales bacterium]|nr:S8 family serine peptidase [Ignavibacteriales bacterium]